MPSDIAPKSRNSPGAASISWFCSPESSTKGSSFVVGAASSVADATVEDAPASPASSSPLRPKYNTSWITTRMMAINARMAQSAFLPPFFSPSSGFLCAPPAGTDADDDAAAASDSAPESCPGYFGIPFVSSESDIAVYSFVAAGHRNTQLTSWCSHTSIIIFLIKQ